MGMNNSGGGGGEIIQVQGGHIVRALGRKDRHSKVYTAKGPRDRRVRLSAHTAIQFYDVQDRLGYDRPSKAVDWLIKKAQSSIDKLAELPPWQPGDHNNHNNNHTDAANMEAADDHQNDGSNEMAVVAAEHESDQSAGYNFQLHNPNNDSSSFIAQHMVPDAIPDDTMKSFFPTSSATSSLNFQSYPHHVMSRTTTSHHHHHEDLGLSLHPFQDQGLIHHDEHSHSQAQAGTSHTAVPHENDQTGLFSSGPAPVGYEASFHRMMGWSHDAAAAGAENRAAAGVFPFNPSPLTPHHQGHGSAFTSAFTQRGPLQSSFMQSIRAWSDLPMASTENHRAHEIHPSLLFGSRFASEGLPDFGSLHGEDEQSVASDRPSSSSPNSQH